jgi:hypothetical protein
LFSNVFYLKSQKKDKFSQPFQRIVSIEKGLFQQVRASAALLQHHFPQNYGKKGCLSLYINRQFTSSLTVVPSRRQQVEE